MTTAGARWFSSTLEGSSGDLSHRRPAGVALKTTLVYRPGVSSFQLQGWAWEGGSGSWLRGGVGGSQEGTVPSQSCVVTPASSALGGSWGRTERKL